MTTNRQHAINTFYVLLNKVIGKFPKQSLDKLGLIRLPKKGDYFFFESVETRDNEQLVLTACYILYSIRNTYYSIYYE